MKVLAAWCLWPLPADAPGGDLRVGDLAPLEERFVAARPRRMGRHARLALLGSSACLRAWGGTPVPDRTGIYLGSGIGNAAEETEVVEQAVGMAMGLRPGPASPVHFANSVSNSATFHVARATGATGPNLVVSQEEASFEGALAVADLALEAGEVDLALAGGVDELLDLRDSIRCRLDLPAEVPLGEGTGWLLVARDGDGALGEVVPLARVPAGEGDLEALAAAVQALRAPGEALRVLPGFGLADGEARRLAAELGDAAVAPYLPRCGTFATAAALAVAEAFNPGAPPGLSLHVARGRLGLHGVLARRFD